MEVFANSEIGKVRSINEDTYYIADDEIGIDIKFPKSGSLRDGKMIAEVEERNPSYLAKCNQLLDLIN